MDVVCKHVGSRVHLLSIPNTSGIERHLYARRPQRLFFALDSKWRKDEHYFREDYLAHGAGRPWVSLESSVLPITSGENAELDRLIMGGLPHPRPGVDEKEGDGTSAPSLLPREYSPTTGRWCTPRELSAGTSCAENEARPARTQSPRSRVSFRENFGARHEDEKEEASHRSLDWSCEAQSPPPRFLTIEEGVGGTSWSDKIRRNSTHRPSSRRITTIIFDLSLTGGKQAAEEASPPRSDPKVDSPYAYCATEGMEAGTTTDECGMESDCFKHGRDWKAVSWSDQVGRTRATGDVGNTSHLLFHGDHKKFATPHGSEPTPSLAHYGVLRTTASTSGAEAGVHGSEEEEGAAMERGGLDAGMASLSIEEDLEVERLLAEVQGGDVRESIVTVRSTTSTEAAVFSLSPRQQWSTPGVGSRALRIAVVEESKSHYNERACGVMDDEQAQPVQVPPGPGPHRSP
jgi:hypothetical protein